MGRLTENPMASNEEDDHFARELEGARRQGDMDHFARVLSTRLRQLDKRCKAANAENERVREALAASLRREDALAGALETVRRTLNNPNPGICCTVWVDGSPAETLSDHVDAALATHAASKGGA